MIIRDAEVFTGHGFARGNLYIEKDRLTDKPTGHEELDGTGFYAIPGLVDVHQHGSMGYEFTTATVEQMNLMAEYQASQGVTALCPTTLTLSEDDLAETCRRVAQSGCEKGAAIVGINLEGPFVSPHKLGAQNPDFVRNPDAALFRRLQAVSGGIVKLLDMAPETEGALDVIRELHNEVGISLAHTTADYSTAIQAFEAGARHVTHLYNAMPPFTHRAPGVIGAAFDTPHCRAELICDNVHIHPSVVRATFKMFGNDRLILISDSMMATGLDDGEYELGGLAVRVEGNTARLVKDGAIAGSVTNLMKCLQTAVKVMGIPLEAAVRCATVNPAKAIGIFEERGSLDPGKIADIVLLDRDLHIRHIFLRGLPLVP